MAVNLSPVGGVAAQFFTNTGAVLTGGKIYTYLAGTTTPATAYTSSNGSTAWTNPIVLDAAGRVPSGGEIWITDGISYKFILRDSNDVLIATYDNITGINSNFLAFTSQQQIITATANQTVFNLSISYQPGTNSLSVFVDGVNQYGPGAQYAYTETDSDTVTFVSGLHVGASVKFTTTQQQGAGAVNASQVTYNPAGAGAVATNVQTKLRETVSVKDFGAVGDGVVDDTTAIQNAINAGKLIYFPAGTYKFSTLQLNHDGCILVGDGEKATVLTSTATSGSIIYNPDQATITRYYCGIKGMQILAQSVTSTSSVKVIDWRSMQFGSIENVWILANGTAGLAGIYLGTITFGVTECTYNYLKNLYIGGVSYGVQFFDGANTNTVINARVQPGPNAFGYHLAFGTGGDRMGNNTFINCACEYPGNTVTGYALGLGANNTTIIAPRLESMSTGIQVLAAATNTTILNAYYDSNITNVSNASTTLNSLGADGLTVFSPDATPNFGVDFSFYGYPGGRTRYLGTTGGATSVTNDAFTIFEDGVYGSTYAGGTNFNVGTSGSYRIISNGNHALGTSDLYWLGLASNNTVRAKIQINGAVNFVPLASDPAGSVAGDVYYNSTTNKLRCYNGTIWNDLF
jgi:hypothetical protein